MSVKYSNILLMLPIKCIEILLEPVIFLASDASNFVKGHILYVTFLCWKTAIKLVC